MSHPCKPDIFAATYEAVQEEVGGEGPPPDALVRARNEGRREGRAEERAAIVAWLRWEAAGDAPDAPVDWTAMRYAMTITAGMIERGEHVAPEEEKP